MTTCSEICKRHNRNVCRRQPCLSIKFVSSLPMVASRMEWTFQCRLLFSSAKHLLICRDVTATTDIRLHYFSGTFAVATNSREISLHFCDACRLHWLTILRGTSCHGKYYLGVYHTGFVQLENFVSSIVSDGKFLTDIIIFFSYLTFYTLCQYALSSQNLCALSRNYLGLLRFPVSKNAQLALS